MYNENAGGLRTDNNNGFKQPGTGFFTGFSQPLIVLFGPAQGQAGDTADLMFFADAARTIPIPFTGSFDIFDIDGNSGGTDQATVTFDSGAPNVVLNAAGFQINNSDLSAQLASAQRVDVTAETSLSVLTTGGSGGFVLEFSTAAIPEPSAAALGLLGGLALLRRRRN